MASTLTNLLYHIVFSTKMRQDFVGPELRRELYSYIGGIIRGEKGIMLKIGGTANHLHILVKLPPVMSVSNTRRGKVFLTLWKVFPLGGKTDACNPPRKIMGKT